MAVTRWNFPDGADGNTLTAALAGADAIDFSGGTAVLSDDQTFDGGALSAFMTSTGPGHLWWAKTGLSATAWAADVYIYMTTAQTTTTHYLIWGGSSSSVRSLGIQTISTTRLFRLVDGGGTTQWTNSSAFPLNTWVRISIYATCHASTGTARAAWYLGNDTTPQEDSGLITGCNTGSSIDRIRVGLKAASTATGSGGVAYFSSWAYDLAATGLIAPPSSGVDNVKIGAAPLLGAYRGSTPVTKLYQGTNLVWTA